MNFKWYGTNMTKMNGICVEMQPSEKDAGKKMPASAGS